MTCKLNLRASRKRDIRIPAFGAGQIIMCVKILAVKAISMRNSGEFCANWVTDYVEDVWLFLKKYS